jgi:hypothetical protein
MSWCHVCGRYPLFGACPKPEMQDPPYPGLAEKTIAAGKPPRPPVTGAMISLDGQPSVRLQTRGQP